MVPVAVPVPGAALSVITMAHFFAPLFFRHPLLVQWACVMQAETIGGVGPKSSTSECFTCSPGIHHGTVFTKPQECVCVFSSHPFWTSNSLDVPAGVTQEEGHTGFLIHLPSAVRALIFVARRIQPFLSLVDREVEFCVLTN